MERRPAKDTICAKGIERVVGTVQGDKQGNKRKWECVLGGQNCRPIADREYTQNYIAHTP